jgi:hypothetical protein
LQREAITTYLEGERLCDVGQHKEGVALLKKATRIAWELEWERWPGWAQALHTELSGNGVTSPARLVGRDDTTWQPELASLPRNGEGWWREVATATAIDHALRTQHVAMIDGLCGSALNERARAECERASRSGELHPAPVKTPDNGLQGARGPDTRSDRIAWADGAQPQWRAIGEVSAVIDELIRSVRAAGDVLGAVGCRERVMVAAYGEGDAFARHSDNHCLAGRGPHCNPRVLTAVYYMSPDDWAAGADGGSLRIYKPTGAAAGATGGGDDDDDGDVLAEIAPLADRLVLFLSDLRVPHEVLPIRRADAERYSAITWYASGDDGSFVI